MAQAGGALLIIRVQQDASWSIAIQAAEELSVLAGFHRKFHCAVYNASAGPDRINIVFDAYRSAVEIVRETDCLAALVKVDDSPGVNVPVRVICPFRVGTAKRRLVTQT